jgi:hypothetical protein
MKIYFFLIFFLFFVGILCLDTDRIELKKGEIYGINISKNDYRYVRSKFNIYDGNIEILILSDFKYDNLKNENFQNSKKIYTDNSISYFTVDECIINNNIIHNNDLNNVFTLRCLSTNNCQISKNINLETHKVFCFTTIEIMIIVIGALISLFLIIFCFYKIC